ncbi:MAG: glycosyltransferase family 2 protein [Myxococcota bacterium]|jgi:glycosyltransferase involved in cell wall biosynthesis|nr:glycosyltransferase family 2 protein [Myxococcota bacterium]
MADPAPLLSLCMIVRNEADRLPGCLRSVEGLVDEVVVVDTGSTDGTPEVAARCGCRVFAHPWEDDFARARNVGLEQACGEWILVLDADEVVSPEEGFDLRRELQESPTLDFGLVRLITPDHTGEREEVWATRLFRRARGFRYRYPVHEQLTIRGAQGRELPVGVLHLGCLDEQHTRERQQRYLELLESLPEDDPHRIVFTVRGLVALGRWREVEAWAERGLAALPADHSALPRLLFQAAVAAFNCDERERTRRWIQQGLARFPDHPDLQFVAMAHAAWLCRLNHAVTQDPGHPLFRQVGDSLRWLGAVEELLERLGVRGAPATEA